MTEIARTTSGVIFAKPPTLKILETWPRGQTTRQDIKACSTRRDAGGRSLKSWSMEKPFVLAPLTRRKKLRRHIKLPPLDISASSRVRLDAERIEGFAVS